MTWHPHFTVEELACHHCGEMPTDASIEYLEAFRAVFDETMPLNSGHRCSDYNAIVSGTGSRDGPHTFDGWDIFCSSKAKGDRLLACAYSDNPAAGRRWWLGIGIQLHTDPFFIHLDNAPIRQPAPRPISWSY